MLATRLLTVYISWCVRDVWIKKLHFPPLVPCSTLYPLAIFIILPTETKLLRNLHSNFMRKQNITQYLRTDNASSYLNNNIVNGRLSSKIFGLSKKIITSGEYSETSGKSPEFYPQACGEYPFSPHKNRLEAQKSPKLYIMMNR